MMTREEIEAEYETQRDREVFRSKHAHDDLVEMLAHRAKLGGLTATRERADAFNDVAHRLNDANLAYRESGIDKRTIDALESIAASLKVIAERGK